MKIKDIIFSTNHITSPFSFKDNRTEVTLSTKQKVAAIALSILIGIATAGIGGVVTFYIITAAMKGNMLNNRPRDKHAIISFNLPQQQLQPTSSGTAICDFSTPDGKVFIIYNKEPNPPIGRIRQLIADRLEISVDALLGNFDLVLQGKIMKPENDHFHADVWNLKDLWHIGLKSK